MELERNEDGSVQIIVKCAKKECDARLGFRIEEPDKKYEKTCIRCGERQGIYLSTETLEKAMSALCASKESAGE